MTKKELVELVKHQINVELPNDPDNILNTKRKILHTQISRKNYYAVASLLNKLGVKFESHVKDYYFIYV
jgi:hypothetical protein